MHSPSQWPGRGQRRPSGRGTSLRPPSRRPDRSSTSRATAPPAGPSVPSFPDGPAGTPLLTLPRPAAHFRTGRFAHLLRDDAPGWPIGRGTGDSDKYARAINDALTDAAVWIDDAQAVETVCRKVYVDSGLDALDTPGAVIRLWSVAS